MVGQPGDDGGHEYTHRDARLGERCHGCQAACRLRGTWLQQAREMAIERHDRQEDGNRVMVGQGPEHIDIAGDECALGDDHHGVKKLC